MDAEINDRAVPETEGAGGLDAHDPPAWREIQARIAALVASAPLDDGWAEASLFWSEIGGIVVARLETLDPTGRARDLSVPTGIPELTRSLRKQMASPEKGAWFSMSLVLERDGDFTCRFNYDRRVFDNPATPFSPGTLGVLPDDRAYRADLAAYPRAEAYRPEWLTNENPSAVTVAPPYDILADAWGWPGVFESIAQQTAAAIAAHRTSPVQGGDEADLLARQILSAVVSDVLEPHRLATLLGLHREAVARRLIAGVPEASQLDPDLTLTEARETTNPALLAVEAGVYGIIGDVVRDQLKAAIAD
jgi:hypothetical protein